MSKYTRIPRKLKKNWKKQYNGMFYQTWRRMIIAKYFGKKYQNQLIKFFGVAESIHTPDEREKTKI